MPCTLREAKTKVKQAEAKKRYPKRLAEAEKQNERTVGVARKGLAKANTATIRFKEEAAIANAQAFKARVGKIQASDAGAAAKVLKTLLAGLREAV